MEFTTVNEEGDLRHLSVNDGDESVPPDFGVLEANPWLSASCTFSPAASEAEAFHDIFGTLSDDQILPKLPVQAMSNALTEREVLDAVDKAETSERKRKADNLFYPESKSEEIGMVSEEMETRQDARPKRTRSAEVHNMSERRRRNRIKGKMRALQELIPNCNKSDTASMLGEAIEYLKALKLQVQMMATSGGAVCQVPYVSIPGIQSIQIPQFSGFMHMQSRPGFGMGMSSTSNSTGLPMIPVPMPFLHPFPSAAVGLYLTSDSRVLPVPQLPVPVMASQIVPTNTATSTVPPQFTRELVSSFKHSNQGESTSQRAPNTAVDSQLSQDALPGSFQPLHMTTTSDVYTKTERKFA